MHTRLALLVLVAALAFAGCTGRGVDGNGDVAQTFEHATGVLDVLVDVSRPFGGFTSPEVRVDDRPRFRLYGDGTVLVAVDAGGSLPALSTYRLSEEGIQSVLGRALAAGLLREPPDYGDPPITDLGTTNVRLNADGRTFEHSAYALGYESEVGDALTPAQQTARQDLQTFIGFLDELPTASPELLRSGPAAYVPEAVEAHAWEAPREAGGTALAWPFDEPLRPWPACVTLGPDDAAELGRILEGVTGEAYWSSGSRLWSVGFRLVLSGDDACVVAVEG